MLQHSSSQGFLLTAEHDLITRAEPAGTELLGGRVARHAREGAGHPAPTHLARAQLCSHMPLLAAFGLIHSLLLCAWKAAERPGAWLLSVALGTAACRAGAQRRAGFGRPLWARGCLGQGSSSALPQPPRPGTEQRCCSKSLRRGTPVPTSHTYFLG